VLALTQMGDILGGCLLALVCSTASALAGRGVPGWLVPRHPHFGRYDFLEVLHDQPLGPHLEPEPGRLPGRPGTAAAQRRLGGGGDLPQGRVLRLGSRWVEAMRSRWADGPEMGWVDAVARMMASVGIIPNSTSAEGKQAAMKRDKDWPAFLNSMYNHELKLGEGAFGTTFKCRDKSTNTIVAVKVLCKTTRESLREPMLPKDYPRFKALIDASMEECRTAQKIMNFTGDPEGARHVAHCIRDGIQESLAKPKRDMPLYVTMVYAGRHNLGEWWQQRMLKAKGESSLLLRKTVVDAMKALRFLTNPARQVQWVHHDLHAKNMVVDNSDPASPHLMVVDLGNFLSTDPQNQTGFGAPYIRPPEVSSDMVAGFALPAHSYDTYSFAADLVSIAGCGPPETGRADPLRNLALIPFAFKAVEEALMSMVSYTGINHIAKCIPLESGKVQADVGPDGFLSKESQWVGGVTACIAKEMNASPFVIKKLDAVRKTAMGSPARKRELTKLVGCFTQQEYTATEDEAPMMFTLINEWMATGFDDVLLGMMATNPAHRPSPAQVLESKWVNSTAVIDLPTTAEKLRCPNFGTFCVSILLLPLVAFGMSCCCGCCCCCACCCDRESRKQVTVLLLVNYTLGAAVVTGAWLGLLATTSGVLASVATLIYGFHYHGPDSVFACRLGWKLLVLVDIILCVSLIIAMKRTNSEVMVQASYILRNSDGIMPHLFQDLLQEPRPTDHELKKGAEILRFFASSLLAITALGTWFPLFGLGAGIVGVFSAGTPRRSADVRRPWGIQLA